jgi:hypothetical protein
MRVNARFEGESERQMEFLTPCHRARVSEVLKASVEHYYKVVSAAAQPRLANLRRFMGKQGSGRTDVSVQVSEEPASEPPHRLIKHISRRGLDECGYFLPAPVPLHG